MKKLTRKRLKAIKGYLDFIQFEYDRQGYISTNTADELIKYCKYFIEQAEQLQQEIERLTRARQSYLQACDELEAHVNEPDIVLSIVSELRAALEGEE